jgi:hypothetical protein
MREIKSIADYLNILLRYVIAGIVTVLVLCYADDQCNAFFHKIILLSPWLLFAIACMLGLLIYSVHQALFDWLFHVLCIRIYKIRHEVPADLEGQIKAWLKLVRKDKNIRDKSKSVYNMRFELFNQTYLRRASKNNQTLCIQGEMDKKLALLNFLYCATYSLLLSPILLYVKYHFIDGHQISQMFQYGFHLYRLQGIFICGQISLSAALLFDYRTTKREIWASIYFFQKIEPDK